MAITLNGTTGLSGVNGSAGTPALQGSDTNTGIFFGTDEVSIATGGSNRLIVDSSGRVGLGTSSPSDILHVNKASTAATVAYLSNTGGEARIGVENDSGTGVLSGAGAYDTVIRTAASTGISFGVGYSAPAVRIDSSGRLGIGTTTPTDTNSFGNALDVNGTAGSALYVRTSGSATNFGMFGHSGTTTYVMNQSNGPLTMWTNNSEKARLTSDGKLLVGTSSARTNYGAFVGCLLQVEGSSAQGISLINNENSTNYNALVLGKTRSTSVVQSGDRIPPVSFQGFDGSNFREAAEIACFIDGTPGTNDMPGRLVFSTTADGASSPTERMRISANGETTFSANVRTLLGLKIGDASGWAGNPAITTDSNVGYIIIRNGASGGVGLTAGGTSWSSLSDENYKTDLEPITGASAKVRSLRSVTGRYIDDDEAVSRSFLIAQDVEAVLPEAVSTAENGKKLLSYTDTIPLLTAALKEALEKIETLEAKVAALEGV